MDVMMLEAVMELTALNVRPEHRATFRASFTVGLCLFVGIGGAAFGGCDSDSTSQTDADTRDVASRDLDMGGSDTDDSDVAVDVRARDGQGDEGVADVSDIQGDVVADPTSDPIGDPATDRADDTGTPACLDPPDDLPAVTFTGTGRMRSLANLTYPDLMSRRVRVYLPEAYASEPERRFPVLYMHDGQNLFDPDEAAYGMAWEADDTLDRLTSEGLVPATIVVAIDNTPERNEDYTPDYDARRGEGGNGDAYVDFVATLVKPLIDVHFRTLCERRNTTLVGSSLGGLISLHAALRHPNVFGRIGAVSPSLWWNNRSMLAAVEAYSGRLPLRLWIDYGNSESLQFGEPGVDGGMIDTRALRDLVLSRGLVWSESLGYLESPSSYHDEHAWAHRLDSILIYLLSENLPTAQPPTDLSLTVFGAAIALAGGAGQTNVSVEAQFGALRLTVPNDDVALESLTPTVASVATNGTVTAVGAGTALIQASFGELTADDSIDVVAQRGAIVTIDVTVPSSTPPGAAIYLAGDLPELGEWGADGLALSQRGPRQWVGALHLPAGTSFEFKVTRGTWETVEKSAEGFEVDNRQGSATDGAYIQVLVARWADE